MCWAYARKAMKAWQRTGCGKPEGLVIDLRPTLKDEVRFIEVRLTKNGSKGAKHCVNIGNVGVERRGTKAAEVNIFCLVSDGVFPIHVPCPLSPTLLAHNRSRRERLHGSLLFAALPPNAPHMFLYLPSGRLSYSCHSVAPQQI